MTRYHQVVGIDIGSRQVRAVLAARRFGTPILVEAAQCPLPSDRKQVPRVLREFLEERGWRRLPCVLGLPTDKLVLRSLALEDDDPRSEQQVIAIETEPYVGPDFDETILDRTRMNGHSPPQLLFAVTRADTVEQTLQGMVDYGITVVDLVPHAAALYNAMPRHRGQGNQRYVCVDLGYERCELIVGTHTCLLHSQQLASPVDYPARTGTEASGAGPASAAEVHAGVEHWARVIRAALDLFQANAAGPAPTSLILSGPGSVLPGVSEELARRTGLETSCWSHEVGRSERPMGSYAVAAGLALSHVDRSALKLSLLPPSRKEAVTLRWQTRHWAVAACFAIAAMIVNLAAAQLRLGRLRTDVESRGMRLAELQQLQADVDALRGDTLRLRRQVYHLQVAMHNGAAMQAVIAAVANAKHADDWIILIADANTYFELDESEDSEPATWLNNPDALRFDSVVVEGYTPVDDLTVLEEMIEVLRGHPYIRDADLVPDDRVRVDAARDQRWKGSGGNLFAIQIATVAPQTIHADGAEAPLQAGEVMP